MKARLHGMCRGDGLAYIAVRFSEPPSMEALNITLRADSGIALPCNWRQLEGGIGDDFDPAVVVVIVPLIVSGALRMRVDAASGDGARSSFKFSIPAERLKWESRLMYRTRKALAYRMRDIEREEDHRRVYLRYDYIVPYDEGIIVRAKLTMPYGEQPNLQFRACDESGEPLEVTATALSDYRQPLKRASDAAFRQQYYSFRFPRNVQGFTIHAEDGNNPDMQGFRSAGTKQMGDLWTAGEVFFQDASCDPTYDEWFRRHRTTLGVAQAQRAVTFDHDASFSIVVPLFNTPARLFKDMLRSVLEQSYANWELILVVASPEDGLLLDEVRKAASQDSRIRYTILEENLGITENTNVGIAASTGDFVCFLDHDDTLEPNALFEYACALEKRPDTDLLYCDEDKMSEDGLHFHSPYFKSDFDIDLLRSHNYVCHFLCVRKSIVESIAPPSSEYDGAQDYNLTLHAAEQARNVFHVRKVLYHWRAIGGSTASDEATDGSVKAYADEAGRRAVVEHLERCKLPAVVEPGPAPYSNRVTYLIRKPSLVSIIIPNKDCPDLLEACVTSVLEKTTYENYEIVIVENNSTEELTEECYGKLARLDERIRIVRWPAEFNFSKIINFGVGESRGEYLLLLNNDTVVIEPDWLKNMLGICQREDVGAVGARLLYPDGTVQHAGVVVTDEFTPASHAFCVLPDSNPGYFNLGVLTHQHSAVTAACLLTKRSVYDEVGGFNEELTVAYNDVDYCFKIRDLGLHVVYEPTAKLYHYESVSRGFDDDTVDRRIRAKREIAYLHGHWPEIYMVGDPFLNPNLCSNHYRIRHELT